ncbi:vWA domain-containing protein, partial [Roseofilum casamattae]
ILPDAPNAEATPADVAILLDMSGSMIHPDSSPGTQRIKLEGAISAINEFIDAVNQESNLNVRIGLAPFATGGNEFRVTEQSLEDNFFESNNPDLKQKIEQLANQRINGSTNLYAPLETTVNYLRKQASLNGNISNSLVENNEPSNPVNNNARQLVIIVLSDGFHNYDRDTENTQFEQLRYLLKPPDPQIPRVTVHTLGYGESLAEIYQSSRCRDFQLTEEQLTNDETIISEQIIDRLRDNCQRLDNLNTLGIDESKIRIDEFIVDRPRLRQIANVTGGIHQFPDNAEEVAQSLIKFLETLREYQLEYDQPGADRATKHEAQIVVKELSSQVVDYRICNIGCPPLQTVERLKLAVVAVIIFAAIGIFPFIKWSQQLRQNRDND